MTPSSILRKHRNVALTALYIIGVLSCFNIRILPMVIPVIIDLFGPTILMMNVNALYHFLRVQDTEDEAGNGTQNGFR